MKAQIVAQAGRSGAITIATNMAGRGTDIVLGGNPSGYHDSILRKHAERVDYIQEIPVRTEDERAEKEEAIQDYIVNMTQDEKNELFQQKSVSAKKIMTKWSSWVACSSSVPSATSRVVSITSCVVVLVARAILAPHVSSWRSMTN